MASERLPRLVGLIYAGTSQGDQLNDSDGQTQRFAEHCAPEKYESRLGIRVTRTAVGHDLHGSPVLLGSTTTHEPTGIFESL